MSRKPPVLRLARSRLRLRTSLAVASVTLIALVAFDFAAITALRSYLINQTDATLHQAATVDAAQLAAAPPSVLHVYLSTSPSINTPATHDAQSLGELIQSINAVIVGPYDVLYWPDDGTRGLALTFDTAVMSTTGPWTFDYAIPPEIRALASGGARTDIAADGTGQVRTVATTVPGGMLVVSTSLNNVDNTVDRMRLILLIGSAAAILLIGLCAFWLLRRGLQPIETMATQADLITAGNLTDRVTHQPPHSEVGRLGTALNGMLTRIQTSVHERETEQELMRRFFADASHELRTPLASLRANAELYQQGALPERAQVDEVMRRIGLEARRMSTLVDDMLRLAHLDQHPDHQHEPVALSELVTGSVDRIAVAAPQHLWHTDIADNLLIIGDEELLRRALDNLLANVRTHTPPGTSTTVTAREHGDHVEIDVADTGPGVPQDRLSHIFDRFYRVNATARPGAGLGLAIVRQIATVHNGTAAAEPNPPHGLRIRITLPPATSTELTHDSHGSPAQD